MHAPFVDADGAPLDAPASERRGVGVKRLIFDWSSMVAIVGVVATWVALAGDVKSNTREIERLRATGEKRADADVRLAETMATKTDVQRLSDQVQALAIEIRNARAVR